MSSFLTEISLEKHRLLAGTEDIILDNAYEMNWDRVNNMIDIKRKASYEVLRDFLSC